LKSLEIAQPEYYQWCELLSSRKNRIFRRGGFDYIGIGW
jgi:hypothetical protein